MTSGTCLDSALQFCLMEQNKCDFDCVVFKTIITVIAREDNISIANLLSSIFSEMSSTSAVSPSEQDHLLGQVLAKQ